MELTIEKVQHYLGLDDWTGDVITDYASEYGEPGYSFRYGGETPMFLIGDWWCRCMKDGWRKWQPASHYYTKGGFDADGVWQFGKWTHYEGKIVSDLHDHQAHHPRFWAQLEAQGVEWAFYDEWVVIDDKAWRTEADSYSWESSIRYSESYGDWLTPDSDIEEWIADSVNDPHRCLTSHYHRAVEEAGFTERECGFANGWFEGMNDDPVKITEAIRNDPYIDEELDILFVLSEASQFYFRFCVFTRPTNHFEEE
jgi:hypothetical protein